MKIWIFHINFFFYDKVGIWQHCACQRFSQLHTELSNNINAYGHCRIEPPRTILWKSHNKKRIESITSSVQRNKRKGVLLYEPQTRYADNWNTGVHVCWNHLCLTKMSREVKLKQLKRPFFPHDCTFRKCCSI